MSVRFHMLFLLTLVQLGGCLLLGAFNIKTFGDKKSSNSTLMEIITQIVHRYDIVLIQEVRDTDLSATNKLMQHVNKGLSPYRYRHIVSEELGRSTYTERYLYLYREETVSVAKNYTYDDGCEPCGTDTFIREPFIVMFSSNYTAVRNFVLIPQHTSPDSAVKEVDALYDVATDVRARWNTNDIVLLGDFNAGCRYVSGSDWQQIRLFTDDRYHWLIPDHADTTVSNTDCPYDRSETPMKHSSGSAQSKLFASLAPQWWNKLPHDARTTESITTFRRHLKLHHFKEYLG
uniref:Deoxyribonuclease I n=1 Tax=Salmo trutta TaxID=8032 RepID=A0A673ZD94_SALTR